MNNPLRAASQRYIETLLQHGRAEMQTQGITIPIYNLGFGGGGSLTIERALRRAPGVAHAHVNPATEMAYVDYDAALVGPTQLRAIIDDMGYGAPPLAGTARCRQASSAAAHL